MCLFSSLEVERCIHSEALELGFEMYNTLFDAFLVSLSSSWEMRRINEDMKTGPFWRASLFSSEFNINTD